MHYYLSNLLIAAAFAILTGCGQTGPLYMPPDAPPPPPVAPAASAEQPSTVP